MFISKGFIIFDAIINRTAFFHSFSDNLLLVYRNKTDPCVLISHSATSLDLLVLAVLGGSLGFSTNIYDYVICKQRQFYFFLSNLDAFYFFFLPDYSGYDFHYYQNKTGKSRHPCLVTDLRRKAFNLSPLSLVLAVGLSYQPLLPWATFLLYPICSEFFFLMNGYWISSNVFPALIEMIWFYLSFQ